MSKHSDERLESQFIASFDIHGTTVDVDYVYLLRNKGEPVDDAGGVRIGLSDVKDMMSATPGPEVAIEIGEAIIRAGRIALEARKSSVVPDGVPTEWTGDGAA